MSLYQEEKVQHTDALFGLALLPALAVKTVGFVSLMAPAAYGGIEAYKAWLTYQSFKSVESKVGSLLSWFPNTLMSSSLLSSWRQPDEKSLPIQNIVHTEMQKVWSHMTTDKNKQIETMQTAMQVKGEQAGGLLHHWSVDPFFIQQLIACVLLFFHWKGSNEMQDIAHGLYSQRQQNVVSSSWDLKERLYQMYLKCDYYTNSETTENYIQPFHNNPVRMVVNTLVGFELSMHEALGIKRSLRDPIENFSLWAKMVCYWEVLVYLLGKFGKEPVSMALLIVLEHSMGMRWNGAKH